LKITTEKAPDSQLILTAEVDEERVEQALNRAYRQMVKRVNIPGFRRGKAPRHIVERHVGRGRFLREAVKPLLEEVYEEAIQAEDLQPISTPQAEMVEVDPLTFRFTISVRPTIELGDYGALRFPIPEVTVEESQVDKVLERVRQEKATWALVERPAQIGDRLLIDVVGGEIDQENAEVLLADPAEGEILGPGVIEGLIGATPGETRTIPVHHPEDSDQELASQSVTYRITVHAIREQELPPLDDDLAATVGDFEDLAALRAHIHKVLVDNAEGRARTEVQNRMVDALAAEATLEAPAAFIEAEIDSQIEGLQNRLQQRGFTMERYLELTKKTSDDLRAELRDDARESVRRSLVLGEFARLEGLDTTSAEVDAEIERLANEQGEAADRIRTEFSKPERRAVVEDQLLSRKIRDRLLAIATNTDTAAGETPPVDEPAVEEADPPAAAA